MSSNPDKSADRKSTQITDLPTKEGNVESEEAIKGGLVTPPSGRSAPRLPTDKLIIPCIQE